MARIAAFLPRESDERERSASKLCGELGTKDEVFGLRIILAGNPQVRLHEHMKGRFRIVFLLLLVPVLGGIAWLVLRSQEAEPVYQGKPLRLWLKGFEAEQTSAEYSAAQSALQQIGTNALPTLISYLRRKDPSFHRQWINLKAKLHLLHGEVDYAVFWHRRAAQACGALGQEAEAAFPALTEAMNDPHAASEVGNGLSRMMPKSVPVLTNILATGNTVED